MLESPPQSDTETSENEYQTHLMESKPHNESGTVHLENLDKYTRPATLSQRKIKRIRDNKLRGVMQRADVKSKEAAIAAAQAEILLPSVSGYLEAEAIEKTYKITQAQLAQNLDQNTIRKQFSLELKDYGPYRLDLTRNGRSLVLASQMGHLAMLDTLRMNLSCEFHVNDLIRDVHFMHNNTMFATAQKKYVYIYDHTGAEAHCIRSIQEPQRLEFLPYHFLLTSISGNGLLSYHDITCGKQVAMLPTKQGFCDCIAQNPWNAVIHLGHASGIVSLWTPNMREAVVKVQCHQGPIRSMCIDNSGKYMVTAGADRKLKVFDLRTYQQLNESYLSAAANNLSISQSGLIAAGFGPQIRVFKDAFKKKAPELYMSHLVAGTQVSDLSFQPFEDVLAIGHSKGFQSIIIPGSGEANFDSFAANPYENSQQRNESEIHSLLEKIRPEMITLDSNAIGRVAIDPTDAHDRQSQTESRANNTDKTKKKMRGRNRPSRRVRRKQQNVIDAQKQKYRELLEDKARKQENHALEAKENDGHVPSALNRFLK